MANVGDPLQPQEEPVIENLDEIEESLPPSAEEIAAASDVYATVAKDDVFPKGPQYPHAGNIAKKLKDYAGKDTHLSTAIEEIMRQYHLWRKATLLAPGSGPIDAIEAKVVAFDEYSSFLDTELVDGFDSRGALVSSALEEFCFYLFEPLLREFPQALVGKQDAYQGLYFTASNFKELLKLPTVHTPVNTLDFIIGADVQGTVKTNSKEEPFAIRLPAVAIECKGYLDRPRFIESQNMARAIKASFPQCMYLLVAQSLKLDLKKIGVASDIDGIYVLRRMQNVDRKRRREDGTKLKPHHLPAVIHLYDRVEKHLNQDWLMADPFGSGVMK